VPLSDRARISELVVGGGAQNWALIGIAFDLNHCAALGDVALRLDASLEPGLHSWVLFGADVSVSNIDGVTTAHEVDQALRNVSPQSDFDLGVIGVDHVVINTPDLMRTSDALTAATGAPLKRVRDAGNNVQQGFHRLGSVVVEIVTAPTMHSGPASLWGFVLDVKDIYAVANHVGPDVLSIPKPAVQAGKLIATFRSSLGLGVPVALMGQDTN
jgi:hypothetical protein